VQIEKQAARLDHAPGGGPEGSRESISTGAINLDAAIGVGGIPRGRVTEIYGLSRAARRRCVCIVVLTRKAGGVAAYIDAEHALDTDYARKLGGCRGASGSPSRTREQALEIADPLVGARWTSW
jgi:recombination protein RecA